nr:hypothetical protein [uncultured archaeon]
MQCIEEGLREDLHERYKHKRIVSLWVSFRKINKELDYAFNTGNYDGFYDNLMESIFIFQKIDKRECKKKIDFWDFLGYCAEKYMLKGNKKTADMLGEESDIFYALCVH